MGYVSSFSQEADLLFTDSWDRYKINKIDTNLGGGGGGGGADNSSFDDHDISRCAAIWNEERVVCIYTYSFSHPS